MRTNLANFVVCFFIIMGYEKSIAGENTGIHEVDSQELKNELMDPAGTAGLYRPFRLKCPPPSPPNLLTMQKKERSKNLEFHCKGVWGSGDFNRNPRYSQALGAEKDPNMESMLNTALDNSVGQINLPPQHSLHIVGSHKSYFARFFLRFSIEIQNF